MTPTMVQPTFSRDTTPDHRPPEMPAAETLGAVLRPIHARWMGEVHRNVLPACDARAGFWPRWSAVRYLADQFEHDYHLEGELLDAVVGSLDVRTASRLVDDRDALEMLRRELDRTGRRRGSGLATAALAGALLQALARWCTDLEEALSSVKVGELTPYADEVLQRVRRLHGSGAGLAQARTPRLEPAAAAPGSERA
jgi:hypothetical protein